jgi:hypothetical protein
MANLSAPQADDLGPGAVLASAGQQVITMASTPLPAPPDVVSALYGPQIPPSSMSFG